MLQFATSQAILKGGTRRGSSNCRYSVSWTESTDRITGLDLTRRYNGTGPARRDHGTRPQSSWITGRDPSGRDNGKDHGTGLKDRIARGMGSREKGLHVTGSQGA